MTEYIEPFSEIVVPGAKMDWGFSGVELTTGIAWTATAKIRNSERSLDWTPACTLTESSPGLWDLRVVVEAAVTDTFPAPARATGTTLLYLDVQFTDPAGPVVTFVQYAVLQIRWTAL